MTQPPEYLPSRSETQMLADDIRHDPCALHRSGLVVTVNEHLQGRPIPCRLPIDDHRCTLQAAHRGDCE